MFIKINKYLIIVFFVIISIGCSINKSIKCKYSEYISSIKEYPHKRDSFTEGLFFYNDELYETTGLYGKSKVYKNISLETGKEAQSYSFDNSIFAEGSVIYKDKLYVLTYKEKKIFEFNNENLEISHIYDYDREGWGLTTNGKYLIASDGSENIYYMDEKLNDVKIIKVKKNGQYIKNINELEYISGYIWANIWKTDNILIINPKTGIVVKEIDFNGILSEKYKNEDIDVLNGIAWNDDKLYITGKNYPIIFEIK